MDSSCGKDSIIIRIPIKRQEKIDGILESKIQHQNKSDEHKTEPFVMLNENELEKLSTKGICKEASKNVRTFQGKLWPKREQNGLPCRKRKWIVLTGSFYGIIFSSGLLFNMSVLFVEFLDEFQSTKADTALIQSVCMGIFAGSGLVSGPIVSKFGERKSQALGTLLAASGIGSSFFANGIPFLVCSIGIVAGFGFSLIFISSYSRALKYFKGRQRFLALGLISIGAGIGGLLYPVLLERLLVTYHWREILLIMSGFILNIMVFSMIGKPWKYPKFYRKDNLSNLTTLESSCDKKFTTHTKEKISFISKFKDILSNKTFICFAIGMMLSLPCFDTISIFLIDFYEFNGVERSEGVWLYSGMSIASTLIRPVPGCLAQNPRIPKLALPAPFVFVGIIVVFLFSIAKSVESFGVLSCIFGMCLGGLVAVIPVNTFDIIGQKNYPTAFGILLSGTGIFNIVGGPAIGFLRDLTGTYDISLYVSCGSLTCSFLFLLISMFCIKDKSSKNNKYEIEVRRKSRRSSILPWKQSLQVSTIENTKL